VLVDFLDDDKLPAGIRLSAARILAIMGPPAKASLSILGRVQREEKDADLRAMVDTAIERIGDVTPEDVKDLVSAFASPSKSYHRAALYTLTALGPKGKNALEAVRKEFKDTDLDVRIAAANTLGAMGEEAKAAIDDRVEALASSEAQLRAAALVGLGGIGLPSKEVLPRILDRVEDKDERVRLAALRTAVMIANDANSVQRAVEGRLKDDNIWVRLFAAEAHAHINRKVDEAMEILLKAVGDPAADVRVTAVNILGEIGPAAKHATAKLTALKKNDTSEQVRQAATEALKKIEAKPKP